jgi:phage baseplate assembly protein W
VNRLSYDLYLTDDGDITITSSNRNYNAEFEYNFHIAPSDSLLFNFKIENSYKPQRHMNQLDYNFYIYVPKYDKIAVAVKDKEYIYQAIKIRLNTELNTVRKNEDLGTDIFTMLHKDPTNEKLQKQLENKVRIAISDILTDYSVSVQVMQSNYLDYHDNVRIVITNNKDVFYYYL